MHWEELFALLFIYGMSRALWIYLKPLVLGFGSLTTEDKVKLTQQLGRVRDTAAYNKILFIRASLPLLMLFLKLDILTILLTINIVIGFIVHPVLRYILRRSLKEFKHE
jgi:hypothetical protein